MYLEAFVLKNTLDGSILVARGKFGLEDHAKGAVSNYFTLRVLHFPGLSGETILYLLTDDLCARKSASP